jgi:nicotinamide mononucleotide transporter
MSNFIWGLTAVILLGFINYICDNTGTWITNWVIQVPMNLLGLFLWKKHQKQNKKHSSSSIKTKELNWWFKIAVLLIVISLTANFYFIFNNEAVHNFWYPKHEDSNTATESHNIASDILDASVLVITIVAMVLLSLRYTDQWYLWILCDIVYVVLYGIQGHWQLLITWGIGLINACYGLFLWKFKHKQ